MVVISGPSTVGKSRVIRCLKDKYGMEQVVSYTSRKRREDETEDIDYHFVDENFFTKNKADFLLWKKGDLGYYGTMDEDVNKVIEKGKVPILDLDVDEALKVKSKFHDAVLVFLLPETLEEIKERLLTRGPERGIYSKEDAMVRYYRSVEMIRRCKAYDYLIQNDDEYDTADYINCILTVRKIDKKRDFYISKWCDV
jgi:guanylate kinase